MYIVICCLILYKTLQNLIFQWKIIHENASVEKIKNKQIFFLCLIKLDFQIETFTSITAGDKLTSLDTMRASNPEIPDPNNRKLPKEL